MKYSGPKCKICKREGMKLFLKAQKCFTDKCPFVKKTSPGDQQVQQPVQQFTIYGRRLREKQKLKVMIGINETQMRNYFQKAKKMKGLTGENLLRLLETRLDNVIYRSGLAFSRPFARQLINHGHVILNGKKVHSPGIQVKTNDEIKIKDKLKENPALLASIGMDVTVPSWLEVNKDELKIKMLSQPSREEISFPVDENLIVEFYTR